MVALAVVAVPTGAVTVAFTSNTRTGRRRRLVRKEVVGNQPLFASRAQRVETPSPRRMFSALPGRRFVTVLNETHNRNNCSSE